MSDSDIETTLVVEPTSVARGGSRPPPPQTPLTFF
jgi:hypothetical protein